MSAAAAESTPDTPADERVLDLLHRSLRPYVAKPEDLTIETAADQTGADTADNTTSPED